MKILHIITRLIRGGAQQNTVLLCAAQVQRGHDVVLAHGPIYGPEGSLLAEAQQTGADLREVRQMVRPVSPWRDAGCYRNLCRLVDELRPDVVQTHSSKAGILGRAAAWRKRVPVVVHTVHGLPFHDQQPPWVNRVYVAVERWAARRCHLHLGVSYAMEHEFARNAIGRVDQFIVVRNGFDLDHYDRMMAEAPDRIAMRRELGVPVDAPMIGIVGRLDALKGQGDLLGILPSLRGTFPDLQLLLIGEGWMGQALRAQVRSDGLEDCVHFTGMVELPQLVALLGALDLHVLPSYREGLPRTLVESLLCGCPIVAYDIDGVAEVCIEGRTGRLVPVGDRKALADTITRSLQNYDQGRDLTECGRRMVRDDFDLRKVAARTEQIYESIRGSARRRS